MIVKIVPSEDFPDDIWLVYFAHKGASANIAIMQDTRDYAHLYNLISVNRRKGEGSALLREIDEYCLSNGITLCIRAEVYDNEDDGIQTNEELREWYEKNGAYFVEYDPVESHPMLLLGKDFSSSRRLYRAYNEGTHLSRRLVMKKVTDRIKLEWERNPLGVIIVGIAAVTAAAKLIDAASASKGRAAYAKQVDYRINTRR